MVFEAGHPGSARSAHARKHLAKEILPEVGVAPATLAIMKGTPHNLRLVLNAHFRVNFHFDLRLERMAMQKASHRAMRWIALAAAGQGNQRQVRSMG